MIWTGLKVILVEGLLFALLPALALAQSNNASISGSVTDPSGAAVPDAHVTLTAVATRFVEHAVSNSAGLYSFPDLVPGPYELQVNATGFRNYAQSGIVLAMNARVRIDVKLVVGSPTQTVRVLANASPLTYQGAELKHSINPNLIQQLPLQFSGGIRNVVNFVPLLPGVTTGGQNSPYEARINGAQIGQDEATLDGITMQLGMEGFSGTIAFENMPISPAAIEEASVLTSNFDVKYGNSPGGIISVVTKSGTSQFHGSGYEFFRNTALNARQFGTTTTPIDKENDFGANVGGPVRVPFLWSGNKKTYFFVNFEGYRSLGAISQPTTSLPTMQERQGDFSDWKTSNGALIPVYDPTTSAPNPAYNPALPLGPNNEPILRQQFPGNVIPSSRLTGSLALDWLKWLPAPNLPGVLNNYLPPGIVNKSGTNSWDVRIDHYYKSKDHFSFTYHHTNDLSAAVTFLPPQVSSSSYRFPQYTVAERASWDHIFSPTLLNNLTVGYLDLYTRSVNIADKYINSVPQLPGLPHDQQPELQFQNFAQLGSNTDFAQTRPEAAGNDTLTWVHGRHSIEFGGDYRNIRQDTGINIDNDSGLFTFEPQETGLPGLANSGSDMASFLLGLVDHANASVYGAFGATYPRADAGSVFAGDTWRFTPKLTLTYGLRWDYAPPAVEAHNVESWLDPSRPNPDAGNLPGALVFAGSNWGSASAGERAPENNWYGGFAPRLGIAYAITPKTVVRTGYGIFYDASYYPGFNGGISSDGFTASPSFSSPDGGITPAFLLQQGFPQTFAKPPFLSLGFDNGTNPPYRPISADRLPYGQEWNLTVEHQFTNNFYVSASYVGNKGTHLYSYLNPINVLNPSLLSMGQELYATFQPGQTSLDGVSVPYAGWVQQMSACGATVAQALEPYPQYCGANAGFGRDNGHGGGTIPGLNEKNGSSIYNALQMEANQRLSHGLNLVTSFTWSKVMTNSNFIEPFRGQAAGLTGVISPYEEGRNWAIGGDDVPIVLSVAGVYELPFGPGKSFLNRPGVLGRVVGGWAVSSIFRYSAGVPFLIRSSQCNIPPQFGMDSCLPGVLPGANVFAQSEGSFNPGNGPLLNAAAFQSPSSFNFYQGAGPVVSPFRTPGYHNQDVALTKTFRLTERVNLQIKGEFFNLWNWHTFTSQWLNSNPNTESAFITNLASPTFGEWDGQVSAPRNIQLDAQITF